MHSKNKVWNLSQYLLHRLHTLGSKDLFGVCGDVVLGFMEQIRKGPVKQINCCNELNAGYAADGYARLHGLGTVVTTFNVGPMSALNAIAGAFAESVPVVMIVGAPERHHAKNNTLLHHTVGHDYSVVREMFRKITVACEYLDDPKKVCEQIDSALAKCLFYKKPIYLELPADMVIEPCKAPKIFVPLKTFTESSVLSKISNQISTLITKAKKPMILLGVELIRHELQTQAKILIEKTGLPFCVFPTAKTVLSEEHPQFLGIYQGDWSRNEVKKAIHESDCVLLLGGNLIDSDTGGFTAELNKNNLIQANFNHVNVKNHKYKNVFLADLINALIHKLKKQSKITKIISAASILKTNEKFLPHPKKKLKTKRFFQRISEFLKPNDIVVVDVGESLYSTSPLLFPKNSTYISQSFYNSIGYSVGAALGAATNQKRRTLLFVGDGSFQIGAQEVSTMIHYKFKPIIFVLNNDGYGIERAIYDGPYNDLSAWKYHLIPEALGGERGFLVETEEQLEKALHAAEKNKKLTFIEIKIGKFDFGDILKKAGAAMAKSSKNSYEHAVRQHI